MNAVIPLSELNAGARGIVAEITADSAETERLSQLGIVPGAAVEVRMRGSGGSPVAFAVHGAVLALRRESCEQIHIALTGGQMTFLLAGNPNVGKSTVFNALTGLKQHTGNWCGKTVGSAEGSFRYRDTQIRLIDTPGTYAAHSDTAEEAAACKVIREVPHDCLIVVCDASCPVRGIMLLLELLPAQPRTVLCLNLMDEAKQRRIRIDTEKMSQMLGIPVIGITAKKRKTLGALLDAAAEQAAANPVQTHSALTAEERVRRAEEICSQCVSIPKTAYQRDIRIDKLLCALWLRYPMMLGLLLLVFWLTMAGANLPSEWLAQGFSALCRGADQLADALHCPAWLSGALIDGMLRGTGWVISVMLPPMAIFFPLFTLLEDAGILPRIAFNLDRCCAHCKACGKQALTMTMGFGCNAVGVTECRIIASRRERLIAILTNALVPCNGRFPALLAVITAFFAGTDSISPFRAACIMTALILLSIGMTFAASALLGRTVLRGEPSSFILELPPIRRPQFGQVIVRSVLDRTIFVLGRAVMTAAPVSLLIWILANLHIGGETVLQQIAGLLAPAGALLGLDGELLLAFILGMPANEIVLPVAVTAYLGSSALTDYGTAASLGTLLTAHGWTASTAVCFLIFMLFHSPCATTLLTICKETGSRRWTFAAFLLPVLIGGTLCILANLLLSL